MTKLAWDGSGQRKFETGVDHGVLYPNGEDGVAWNGLTTVTETPGGADNNKTYADNIVYGALRAAETFGGTIEAYTCPDEFLECDGFVMRDGVVIGQQPRKGFGMYYRTIVGTDLDPEAGHKHHFVYGATTSPSERAYATVNDSPEMTAFSWEFESSPVSFTDAANLDLKPTAILTIDDTSPLVDADALADLLDIALGTVSDDPRLPTPDEVLAVFSTGLTDVSTTHTANQPTYVDGTHVITLPSVTGIQWKIDGVNKSPGAQPALTSGQTKTVTATPAAGYNVVGDDEWIFSY
jgi:hypothetical protein